MAFGWEIGGRGRGRDTGEPRINMGSGNVPGFGRPTVGYTPPRTSGTSGGTGGVGLGRALATRTIEERFAGKYNQNPGPSLADWKNTYNAYLSQAQAQNAAQWADNQARLASLMDEANQRRIAADLAGLGAGIDQRLMNQLGQLARQEGRASIDALFQQDDIAKRLAALTAGGYRADSSLIDKQADSIRQQLAQERRLTEIARREGRNVYDSNVRNIMGAAGAAGAFSSSATDDIISEQDRDLQVVLDKAAEADIQSRREYHDARNLLMREREKIAQGMSQNDINLMNQLAQNQRGRESIFNNAVQQELQRRAAAEKAAAEARAAQEQANAFYRGIQEQQALAFFRELEGQQLARFFAGLQAGPQPNAAAIQANRALPRGLGAFHSLNR